MKKYVLAVLTIVALATGCRERDIDGRALSPREVKERQIIEKMIRANGARMRALRKEGKI